MKARYHTLLVTACVVLWIITILAAGLFCISPIESSNVWGFVTILFLVIAAVLTFYTIRELRPKRNEPIKFETCPYCGKGWTATKVISEYLQQYKCERCDITLWYDSRYKEGDN